MSTLNFDDDKQLEAAFAEAVKVFQPPAGLQESVRQRLSGLLMSQSPQPGKPRNRITHWLRRLTVKQRIALGGVGVAAVLGFFLVWAAIVAEPLSAMEKMAENVRRARSLKATMIAEMKFAGKPGKPSVTQEISGTIYMLAPGSTRVDFKVKRTPTLGEEDTTDIDIAGKPGILIDHKAKKFSRQRAGSREKVVGPDMIQMLGTLHGRANRDLGIKQINGKSTRGFEIDWKKIEPNAPGLAEVWVDDESHLPILIRWEFQGSPDVPTQTTRMQDIQWNIDLNPKLFDPTPPKGYVDKTPEPPTLEKQVRFATEGLKLYAELSGGHYPEEIPVGGGKLQKDLMKMIGYPKWQEWPFVEQEYDEEFQRSEMYPKFRKAMHASYGLNYVARILYIRADRNPDAAYYGKTVGPDAKDKVLLRWKLDDGRYEVIFGDLRSETVTAERLRALEGK